MDKSWQTSCSTILCSRMMRSSFSRSMTVSFSTTGLMLNICRGKS
uniref:Uncharacterized protein n=1 Tax=Rhizobium phage LG08 TaxID=3129229 RepID=A0AAU8HXS9_9CAUD